jgi:hypothetical protein
MQSRIMYIEQKFGVVGPGRIGRVTFSKTGKTLHYGGKSFASLKGGGGLKTNYYDTETREEYWISGPRKDGNDTLYSGVVDVDEDVRVEYWTEIRGMPERVGEASYRSPGKHPAS